MQRKGIRRVARVVVLGAAILVAARAGRSNRGTTTLISPLACEDNNRDRRSCANQTGRSRGALRV